MEVKEGLKTNVTVADLGLGYITASDMGLGHVTSNVLKTEIEVA